MASYDVREKVWNPPMPLLFQRAVGPENHVFAPTAIRKLIKCDLGNLAAAELGQIIRPVRRRLLQIHYHPELDNDCRAETELIMDE
ncbi:hypothetical protein ACWDGI_20675 [Streptomyces sp. NPDC001220]